MSDLAGFFKTATVISANPKTGTCDIMRTEGDMLYGVAVANTTGGMFSTDAQWCTNLRGAVVYYGFIDGCPYIFGTLPARITLPEKVSVDVAATSNGGANDNTYGKATAPSYASGRNTDQQPNDKIISSDGGSSLSLLGDGSAILKVSPLCQLIFGAGMDFVRLVARQFQIFTDFGALEFSHGSSGRNGLTIKGGAEYGAESQAGSGVNTVFMHLGDTEDAPEVRYGVRVTSTDGSQFGALAMGKDGRLIFTTSQNYLLSVGKEKHTLVDGDVYDEFRMNHAEKLGQSRRTEIGENEDISIGMKKTQVVGSDHNHAVGANMNLNVGGTLTIGCDGLVLASQNSGGGAGCDFKCSHFNIVKA